MAALTPDRWRAASAHLDHLLDAPPHERAARLDQLRTTDPQVADDVGELLAAHESAVNRQFLETPPPPPPGSGPAEGSVVGAYRIVSLIGHGGMGSVWLAERADGRFEGHAAIKVLNSTFMNSEGERRFRREGTILARLTHPHIARLIDAGVTDTGRPFLVLEHINGRHIDDHVREQKLSVDATLRLFLDVLAAVGLAHANLIVHRDLKPSNVLVTAEGDVKLLDFGIATLLQADTTSTDAVAPTRDPGGLTPRYASPEQMLGQPVTTATDVYALGVLLFTLLAGRHPAGDGPLPPAALVKSIVEQDAPRVSSVATIPARQKLLAGDIDRIVAKALAKSPADRYRTVEALADDIRRFRRHEPISARPDTWSYRTLRFVRRRRRALAVAAILTVGAAGVTTFYGMRLRQERDRATLEARKSQRISQLLTSLLRGADPYRDPDPGADGPTVLSLLDAGAARVDVELADQPALRAEMLSIIGKTYERMGRMDRARPLLERAVDLGRSLSADGSIPLAQALNDLGVLVREQGDAARGRDLLEESVALRRRLLGPRHQDVAITLVEYARALEDMGRLPEAEAPIREALAIRLEVFGARHRETATSKSELALLLRNRGALVEAEQLFRDVLETNLAVLEPQHPNVAISQGNLALVLAVTGRAAEAERLLRTSIESQIAVMGPEHVNVAHALHNLSGTVLDQGRTDEAIRIARDAVTKGARQLAADHPRLATFQLALVRALLAGGRPAEAEPLARHVLEVRRQSLDSDDWRIGQAESFLGAALFDLRRYEDAAPYLKSADSHLADIAGPQARDKQANTSRLSQLPPALR